MNKEDQSEVVRSFVERYQNSSVPTALIDGELKAIWANEAALSIHPGLRLPDGFLVMVPESFSAAFLAAVRQRAGEKALNFELPFTNRTLSLLPLDGGGPNGLFIMHSVVSNEVGTALKPAGSERLISAFSNQFRTPLTSIFSTLSAFRSIPTLEDNLELSDYIQNINENCYQMLRSTLDITEYIKQQATRQVLELGVVDVCDYLKNLCQAAQIVTGNNGIPLFWELPEEEVLLVCDQGQLTFAILQLINNSCRYTREGNSITVSLKDTPSNVIIAVRDRGQGIPADIQEKVFAPYFSNDPFGSPYGGLGLGLTLAKHIITLHHGTVALSSTEEEGTTVVFTLPKRQKKDLSFCSPPNPAGYLLDRYSAVYILLSDTCTPPKP